MQEIVMKSSINVLNGINSVEYQELLYRISVFLCTIAHPKSKNSVKDFFHTIPTLQAAFTESTRYQVLILDVKVCDNFVSVSKSYSCNSKGQYSLPCDSILKQSKDYGTPRYPLVCGNLQL